MKVVDERGIGTLHHDEDFQDIVLRRLSIIGEAAVAIRSETEPRFPEIDWRGIRGFRNYIVHGYFDLLWDKVELAIALLPDLVSKLHEALAQLAAEQRDVH